VRLSGDRQGPLRMEGLKTTGPRCPDKDGSGPNPAPKEAMIMKGNKIYFDLGSLFDDIFEAARSFSENVAHDFQFGKDGPFTPFGDENVDYYPNYCYPPMNLYMLKDRTLVFEFAVSGFEESDIQLSFQGDYMTFAATMSKREEAEEGVRYLKRRLKMKDIEKQKYFVPADKFDQSKVKALFRNGILKVTVPARVEPETSEGVKIEIVKEGK
jgi:HSP20 family molecular chaperone IbpA